MGQKWVTKTVIFSGPKVARQWPGRSFPGLHPERMNQAGEVAQQGKDDIEDEGPAKTFADKHTQWWQDNCENDSPKPHINS